jgi:hypothetical protein
VNFILLKCEINWEHDLFSHTNRAWHKRVNEGRSAAKRRSEEGRDGGNREIEREERRFRIRGARLSYIGHGSPGGDREFNMARLVQLPFVPLWFGFGT